MSFLISFDPIEYTPISIGQARGGGGSVAEEIEAYRTVANPRPIVPNWTSIGVISELACRNCTTHVPAV
ncbi:hypothetical protein ACSQ76_06065 [Roseovarius sp. B08]|uniref:hypothetical protein n=1 Tax=Roseovarius sp. B08 TaxID=3449223 RepID=UPI003EDBF4B2